MVNVINFNLAQSDHIKWLLLYFPNRTFSVFQVQAQEEVTPVENLDFFTDMTPQVSRQTKVYVGPSIKNPSASRLGVLGATTDVDVRRNILNCQRITMNTFSTYMGTYM